MIKIMINVKSLIAMDMNLQTHAHMNMHIAT